MAPKTFPAVRPYGTQGVDFRRDPIRAGVIRPEIIIPQTAQSARLTDWIGVEREGINR